MKKRSIRCYRGFASLPGKFNIEVFYTVPDFGYWNKMFTCTNCSEIFFIDLENPAFKGKSEEQIAINIFCPKCGKRLSETIRPYPENFRVDDGRIGSFIPSTQMPSENESIIHEFFEVSSH